MGTPPSEPSQNSGKITVADRTQNTQSVKCTQVDWSLGIVASAEPGRARALLQLGGDRPIVRTVNIENIDGLSGVAGGDIGKAEASANGSSDVHDHRHRPCFRCGAPGSDKELAVQDRSTLLNRPAGWVGRHRHSREPGRSRPVASSACRRVPAPTVNINTSRAWRPR